MLAYRNVFPRRNTFLAVIHAEDMEQAMRNIAIAQDNGADGVFLINHSISPSELISIYATARLRFPSVWMGMNMLGLTALAALGRMPDNESGLWTDNAGLYENGETCDAQSFLKSRSTQSSWNGIYFGGVAFKYQHPIKDIARVAQLAKPYVDVVTTSGDGTGIAADVEKIKVMKQAIGTHPLAIASGITPENVNQYTDWADCFLVATGVSNSHTELNPQRVAKLAKVITSS